MVIKIIDIYTVSTKNGHLFIFSIALSKLADFNAFWCWNSGENLTLTAYLYTVTTLPWEIQNSHFSTVLFIQTSYYYVISEETNFNCCTAAYLFTYRCLLLPIICVALFCGQFLLFFVSRFQSHQCQITTVSCQSHQHLDERNITCSQM